jgi:N-acetylglucosaminyl-diphospho-decaprenol L-rhamnosyltransferase
MKKNNFSNLTVIMVSFKSNEKITKLIKKLDKKIKIIIVENSMNYIFKDYIEKKYLNIKVLIPQENKGYGAGVNFAVSKTKTDYVLALDCDVTVDSKYIANIFSKAKKLKNFGVITAKIKGQNYKNLIINRDKKVNMPVVSFNTGVVMLFKKNTFLKIGKFDEKIFLYFEETDIYKRLTNNNKKIYLYEDKMVTHVGSRSINAQYKNEFFIFRNWHYCWSKFYYYYKHENYFVAFSKTSPNLLGAFFGIIKGIVLFNNLKFRLSYAELCGLFKSYLLLKSSLRMNIIKKLTN